VIDLENVVATVAGVEEVYRARPTIGAVAGHLREITGARALTPIPRVVVEDRVMRVSIGTDGTVPAPEVARAVHDALHAAATTLGVEVDRIDVTVARVG
jgi:hypothetical protein